MIIEATRTETREFTGNQATLAMLRKNQWTILTIDEKEVLGFCENCGKPIMSGEDYGYGPDDSAMVCKPCCPPEDAK